MSFYPNTSSPIVYQHSATENHMLSIKNAETGIIDIGIGNVKSVERMLLKAGGLPVMINRPNELNRVQKVILPGVGHFDAGMKRLKQSGLDNALIDSLKNSQLIVLGICLGMQLLCNQSDEGLLPGLGLINADVNKFSLDESLDIKVPHMGWNTVKPLKENRLLPQSLEPYRFYFVHSFKVTPSVKSNIVIGETDYGGAFCSAFQQENILGVQFHPEKSHRFGLALMQRFLAI